jgi:hypothetical protein
MSSYLIGAGEKSWRGEWAIGTNGSNGNHDSRAIDFTGRVKCQIWQEPGWVCSRCCLFTRDGGVVEAYLDVPLAPIQQIVAKYLANRVGWGFSDIVKGIKGVANKVARARIIQTATQIALDPRAAGLLGIVNPAAGIGLASFQSAVRIVDRAKQGDAHAIAQVEYVNEAAQEGDLKAIQGKLLLKKGYEIRKLGLALPWENNVPAQWGATRGMARDVPVTDPKLTAKAVATAQIKGVEIGGWVYNKPYRALPPGSTGLYATGRGS